MRSWTLGGAVWPFVDFARRASKQASASARPCVQCGSPLTLHRGP